ncbi:cytochrome c [Ramlibacter albus]|jgi:cytochrome c553|uniref:Cytochrome c n=1 Tax=Ramlibacter albus TaxID=2079448 RepID=A0A923MDG3_9BURK|nr:cytochrome c [Ramlibacter albus]MBC5767516.1 cytochrome c [Ramlibacter albus]MDE2614797.1 cytochrome c [Burkholderiales bacterium]
MKRNNFVPALAALAFAVATLVASPAALAAPKRIELPADGVVLKPSALPGYAKAQAICAACHSAEYMQYQPPTAPRAYWDAMAKRMKVVFKAPIADDDIPLIVDYLVKTYGNEQSR